MTSRSFLVAGYFMRGRIGGMESAPRFQTKDLLIGISTVAAGLALLTIHATQFNAWAVLSLFAWPLVFAGVLKPFKRAWLGFVVGLLLVFAVLVFSLIH